MERGELVSVSWKKETEAFSWILESGNMMIKNGCWLLGIQLKIVSYSQERLCPIMNQ